MIKDNRKVSCLKNLDTLKSSKKSIQNLMINKAIAILNATKFSATNGRNET